MSLSPVNTVINPFSLLGVPALTCFAPSHWPARVAGCWRCNQQLLPVTRHPASPPCLAAAENKTRFLESRRQSGLFYVMAVWSQQDSLRSNSHKTRRRKRKQMEPAVANGSVHTARKQYQRNSVYLLALQCGLGLSHEGNQGCLQQVRSVKAMWSHDPHHQVFSHLCQPPSPQITTQGIFSWKHKSQTLIWRKNTVFGVK